MKASLEIRTYRPGDFGALMALEARVQPYRPEDQTEVDAMIARAAEARRRGDRWVPLEQTETELDPGKAPYSAFWVADSGVAGRDSIVGAAGVAPFGLLSDGVGGLAEMTDWARRGDAAELLHMRVAPELRRQGVGTALCKKAIDWARSQQYRTLVLNTTSPQAPALALYRGLGFREVGRSYLDRYELVWHQLELLP
jgi:ribosomal protein S18 acetylase RimI-like enzyme